MRSVRLGRRIYWYGFRRAHKISPRDGMFEPQRYGHSHYAAVGQSALSSINGSLTAAEKSDIGRILDFGCGHGRDLRVLRQAFPAARITASDMDRDGVDFCARTFGAIPVYSTTDPAEVKFDDPFDLIWAGSVFTHIDQSAWAGFLKVLASSLTSDGVLVLTTHGPQVARWIEDGSGPVRSYGLDEQTMASVLADYSASGFGYGDYPGWPGYGISLASPEAAGALIEASGLRVVNYTATAWDNHQDVYGCVRAASPA